MNTWHIAVIGKYLVFLGRILIFLIVGHCLHIIYNKHTEKALHIEIESINCFILESTRLGNFPQMQNLLISQSASMPPSLNE